VLRFLSLAFEVECGGGEVVALETLLFIYRKIESSWLCVYSEQFGSIPMAMLLDCFQGSARQRWHRLKLNLKGGKKLFENVFMMAKAVATTAVVKVQNVSDPITAL
jgi:hypothetical protein